LLSLCTVTRAPSSTLFPYTTLFRSKEPQQVERRMLRESQILFTYLHLAPDPEQTKDLVASKAICIAYETVTGRRGLPLLKPMSQDRKSTRLNSSHVKISYAVFCLKK